MWKKTKIVISHLGKVLDDEGFLRLLHLVENSISKVLSTCLIIVIFISSLDLVKYLYNDIFSNSIGSFSTTLIEIFGLFLNILIAMELLENISGFLKKNVVQVELVIITSIIAVARKIIIFDLNKYGSIELISLVVATLGLSASYWLLRRINHFSDK